MTSEGRDLLRTCAAELSIALSPEQLSAFDLLYTELQKWNRKINLTAIRDERNIVLKHFIDSLTLLGLLDGVHTVLDLGSGGGFPILPLKIMVPELAAVSVDAVEKKILFQRHAARLLGLREFSALHVRGEHLKQDLADSFDCVVSRAFSDLAYFAALAAPLLKQSGRIIAMKGREGRTEVALAKEGLTRLGVEVTDCIHCRLPACGDDRYLVVMVKH